jgi:hypothetical protein
MSTTGTTSTFLLQISDVPANGQPVEQFSTTVQVANMTRTDAEWIVEAPQPNNVLSPLANFGQVTFSNAWATAGSTTGAINLFPNWSLNMANPAGGQVTTSPVPLDSAAGSDEPGLASSSFTVTYGL